MSTQQVREICNIGEDGKWVLQIAMERQSLSARACDRILKVARTIADLDASETIEMHHLSEAIQFRSVDEHKQKTDPFSFTAKYNLMKLVYDNHFTFIENAIAEEKRIKGGSRQKKIILIETINQGWRDLIDEIF